MVARRQAKPQRGGEGVEFRQARQAMLIGLETVRRVYVGGQCTCVFSCITAEKKNQILVWGKQGGALRDW